MWIYVMSIIFFSLKWLSELVWRKNQKFIIYEMVILIIGFHVTGFFLLFKLQIPVEIKCFRLYECTAYFFQLSKFRLNNFFLAISRCPNKVSATLWLKSGINSDQIFSHFKLCSFCRQDKTFSRQFLRLNINNSLDKISWFLMIWKKTLTTEYIFMENNAPIYHFEGLKIEYLNDLK